jgi:hypothetical protein
MLIADSSLRHLDRRPPERPAHATAKRRDRVRELCIRRLGDSHDEPGPFEDLDAPRAAAHLPDSTAAPPADIPERTYWRRPARLRDDVAFSSDRSRPIQEDPQ